MSQCVRSTCCLAEKGFGDRWRWFITRVSLTGCGMFINQQVELLLRGQLKGFLSLGEKNSEDLGRASSWCFLTVKLC